MWWPQSVKTLKCWSSIHPNKSVSLGRNFNFNTSDSGLGPNLPLKSNNEQTQWEFRVSWLTERDRWQIQTWWKSSSRSEFSFSSVLTDTLPLYVYWLVYELRSKTHLTLRSLSGRPAVEASWFSVSFYHQNINWAGNEVLKLSSSQ